MLPLLDDSLVLGYNATTGNLLTAAETHMSVSTIKMYEEDPMRFYLKKVRRLKEAPTVSLVWGTAGHAAMEAFYRHGGGVDERVHVALEAFRREIRASFGTVIQPTIRINPTDPTDARGKVEVAVTVDDVCEMGAAAFEPTLRMLAIGWDQYTPLMIQRQPVASIERLVGEVAAERGRPTVQMPVWDPRKRERVMAPLAVVGGVGFHGYIDAILPWPDGSPMIMDFKFTGNAVPFYSSWSGNGSRTAYAPSYDPHDDFQLDLYSYATGITRTGFQWFLKQPQYVPPSGILHPKWINEPDWKRLSIVRDELPAAWALSPDGQLRWLSVWRPAPEDHPSRPDTWTAPVRMGHVIRTIRETTQAMTESFLLWKSGVEPVVAFPPGAPEDIASKSCPFCTWGPAGDGQCPQPWAKKSKENELHAQLLRRREVLCNKNKDILERRALWASMSTTSLS